MENIAKRLNAYITAHPFDSGDSDCETVLDQLYQAYAESHESDPPDISEGFKELEELAKKNGLKSIIFSFYPHQTHPFRLLYKRANRQAFGLLYSRLLFDI